MLIGSKYYVTFDKKYYDFQGSCTYLLATDFVDHNYTLLVSYDEHMKNNELIIVLHKTVVRVDLERNVSSTLWFERYVSYFSFQKIIVGDSKTEYLPTQIGNVYLYRESGYFVMESSTGFRLECNMKYQICTFEISGEFTFKLLWSLDYFMNIFF